MSLETSLTGKALVFGPREYGFESRVSNNIIRNSHAYFLNQLKLSSSGRRYYFDVFITTSVKSLVRILQSLNVIRRFYLLRSPQQIYRVFPAYSRHRRYVRSMSFYTKSNGRPLLTLRSLRLLNINSPATHYILETSKGIMSQKEAIYRGLGGTLLLIVH